MVLDKFEPYDLLGIVIPGVLLAYWLPVCFPQVVAIAAGADFPETVDVVGFAAIAIFFGHLIQAVASALQPILYAAWGGTPSERALDRGLGKRYLSAEAGKRIRERLAAEASVGASDQDLFQMAMARANGAPGSRSERFNALYAYHRALIVVVLAAALFLVASRRWGAAASWSEAQFCVVLAGFLGILIFIWYRAKQRAFYYVREILLVAERTLAPMTTSLETQRQEGTS